MRLPITVALLALSLGLACAVAAPVTVTVDPARPLEAVGPVSPMMVGINLPVHTEPEAVARYAVTPPGTNGNWEALRPLNVGLIRQWINAPECGLHDLDPPHDAPAHDAAFAQWLRAQLAPDAQSWAQFDRYLHGIARLGDGVRIMLNEPVPPVWLGPFRWHDRHAGELIDLTSGEVVDYQAFVDWAGLDRNRIGDVERFERLCARFALYMQLLAAHMLADPVLRERATMITLGNETDGGGVAQNSVRWRMWVYGAEANARFAAGEPIRPIDEGVLQRLYLAMHAGVRAADPEGRIALGGPETSWSHNQLDREGRFWYLDWFIDGVNGVAGVGRDRLDLLTWHNYGFEYDYGRAARQLFRAYGKPTFLTEYNATAGGHGMNFMQRGAQTVAKVVIELAQTPGAAGAAFFKASGGGFGLILKREGVIWHTGAYFALKLIREEIVGGRPVRCAVVGDAAGAVECLAVRRDDGAVALLVCNLTDETTRVALRMPGDGPLRTTSIELPVAHERGDYRNVGEDEIAYGVPPAGLARPTIALAPHGVAVVVRG